MKNKEDILFIDIETVPQSSDYGELDGRWKELWDRKSRYIASENEAPDEAYAKAGIYAEFGKIICISAAFMVEEDDEMRLRVKSFYGHDEKAILEEFCELLNERFNKSNHYLCAHNGKEFDYPYLCRRILTNGIAVPDILNLAGKKPWEVRHFDTMQLWKFGDFKSYTSLDLLAAVFGIPTPKAELDGSMIYDTYYKNKDLDKIVKYCQKDVVTLANIFLKMKNQPIVEENNIVFVE